MMSELRKRRKALESRVEKTVGGSSDKWLREFLVQQFLLQYVNNELAHGRHAPRLSLADVEEMWEAGLIERVEGLEGSMLLFVEGFDLKSAQAAIRVRKSIAK